MRLSDQHKALLITFLIAGTVVMLVFSLSLKQKQKGIAESYYEIEPEEELTEEELKVIEALEKLNNSKAETNAAFNQNKSANKFAQAYKTIAPPEDYVPNTSDFNSDETLNSLKDKYKNEHKDELDNEALSKFDKANDVLKKQLEEGNNSKSTIGFSLKGRTKVHIPIPVYLCENSGTIVVNITVNAQGSVVDAYVNTTSNSENECLIEHALEYAKESVFSGDASKVSQIGSITFNFIGKN
ncbi:hypothetical protein DFQ02_101682 [Seonamhaeicola aphaedonensis]|uniref:TonB family protein n=2 Tax=Seonamhaeicola aphaedonensis TaxID=1461338 RepID=A0A3D9HML4_9FLAO|nr:hypothetical protein DFQ02_101682 [Seonamhaeicola aphaedonensis]